MADRLPQYSMIPQNYNNNFIHAQQQHHLQPQQPQGNPQSQQQGASMGQEQQQSQQPGGGGMSEQQRLWMIQQFTKQNPGSDLNGVNPTQLAEFLKRNQFARAQHQQGQSQLVQQPFGGMNVGMSQMGNGGSVLPGNAQQPSFHENSGQPSQMPQGFSSMGGMPNGGMNPAAVAAATSIQGRNTNMMPVSNAERERQMGLLFAAQPQTGPGHMKQFHQQGQPGQGQQPPQPGGPGSSQQNAMREAQQNQFGNQPSPADMFSSPAMSQEALRRASPHPNMGHPQPGMGQVPSQNAQPGVGVGGGGAMQPGRPNLADMTQRVNSLKASIMQLESALPQFQQRVEAARGTPMEGQFHLKLKEAHLELAKRKEQFRNFMLIWRQQHPAQPGNMVGVTGGAPDQNPHAWMGQSNQGQSFDGSNGRPQMGQPPHMQTSPNLGQSQAQANPLMNQGLVPPRSIPTPQQNQPTHGVLQSPFPGGMNTPSSFKPNPQGMPPQQGNVPGMQGNNGAAAGFPGMANMVLDKQRFDTALKTFCMKRNMKLDLRLLSVENRNVDLHGLHVQVMQEGGFAKVEGNDSVWAIIGGKLGFVQFPGEPAKSGPGVAQQLQHIYKEYLAPFETWYISALHDNRKQQIQMATANLQAQLNAIRSPFTMHQAPQLANFSVHDLHARGIDDKTIQFIETNRPLLQRLLQEQRSFAAGLRTHQSQGSMQMNDQPSQVGTRPPGLGASMQFPGPSGQQQANQNAAIMANRQLMFNQQANGPHMQGQLPGGMLGQRMPSQPQQPMPGQMPPQLQHFMSRNHIPMAQAAQTIKDLKAKFPAIDPSTRNIEVHVSQQMEYNQLLEQLHRQCHEFEGKLPMTAVFMKEEAEPFLKKMVDILCTVNQQRTILANASSPRYILGYETLRDMAAEMARVNELFISHLRSQNSMGQMHKEIFRHQPGQPLEQGPQPPNPMPHMIVPPVINMNKPDITGQQQQPGRPVPGRPPSSVGAHQPQQPPQMQGHQQMPPQNMGQPLRPPVSLQPPPKRKQPQQNGGPVSTPSPAAMNSTPTPIASASTPTATASSPSAPTKSPKAKPTPKPKAAIPKPRRPSKVATPNVPPVAAVTPESAQPSASASTPSNNGKRQREEETTLNLGGIMGGDSLEVANEGSPPKRAKTEWEAQPSEAMVKQEEAIANIKTEEEATNFFDQIQELIKAAGSQEDGQHVTTGIAKTLDIFLKGYGPEASEGMASGSGSGGEPRETTPPPPLADAFDEFFDFSFGTVEDEDSKAATPDLVSSSSTNPSPESNHDAEAGHHLLSSTSSSAMDVKTEDIADPLRLGPWKEIDGGEGAYYQTADWKWDSPMPTLEQPWAIFNS